MAIRGEEISKADPRENDNTPRVSRRTLLLGGVVGGGAYLLSRLVPSSNATPVSTVDGGTSVSPALESRELKSNDGFVAIESLDSRWPKKSPEDWFKNPTEGLSQLEEAVLRAFSYAVFYPLGKFTSPEQVYEVLKDPEKRKVTPKEDLTFFFQPPRKFDGTAQKPIYLDARKGLKINFVQGLATSGDETIFGTVMGQVYRIRPGEDVNVLEIDNSLLRDRPTMSTTLAVVNGLWALALKHPAPEDGSNFGNNMVNIVPDVTKALGVNFLSNEYRKDNWAKAEQDSIFK